MDEKDANKSPMNVQKANTKRRLNKRSHVESQLKTKYGMTFQNNPTSSARLAEGLSTVALENKVTGIYGLKSAEDVKKFEELNGMKITPDYDNMND